jgi:TolB-like protein
MSTKPSFFAELQRRHVYKVGAMYGVAGWLLVQIVTQVLPVFDVSALGQRILVLIVMAGFPVALVLAWLFDMTPDGIVRTPDTAGDAAVTARQRHGRERKLNYVLGGLLVLALGYFVLERTLPRDHGAAVATNDKSIAVLPFENLSDDKANAYFATGIQDEILTRLAKVGELKVISRTSTQRYAAKPGNLPEIAKQLGVANILEGSVQKAGDAVHINVQLIRAATDEHLWAESYNRKLDDIFGVEGEVAQTVADTLRARLTGAEKQRIAAKLTDVPAAYDSYLRGLAFSNRGDALVENQNNAIIAFQEATRLDPGFGAAWAMLSREHAFAYWLRDRSAARRQAAREALATAQKLAPAAPETLMAQGLYLSWVERDDANARTIFEQARQLAPNDPWPIHSLAAIARRQGHWDESLRLFEQALALNPRDMLLLVDAGRTALATRDLRRAQRLLDRGLDVAPDDPGERLIQVTLLQETGKIEAAQQVLDRMRITAGDDNLVAASYYNAVLGRNYASAIALLKSQLDQPQALGAAVGDYQRMLGDLQRLAGDADAAKRSYEQARATLPSGLQTATENVDLIASLAQVEAGLGDQASALALAQRAIALRPASRYAGEGPGYEEILARLQARFGEKDAAIAAIGHLLTVAYFLPPLTPAALRLDPDWDNLRGDPAFEKLLADHAAAMPAQATP